MAHSIVKEHKIQIVVEGQEEEISKNYIVK